MNAIELKGTIVSIGEEQRKSDKFSIRQFKIEIGDDRHSNVIPCDLFTDDMDMIDPYMEGQSVICQIYLRGWDRGVNVRCVGIQPMDYEQRNYKPRKEPEPELPLPDQPNYASGEVIPFGRTAAKHEDANAEDVLGAEEPNDLPF